MNHVLDASFFFADRSLEGDLFTTPSVVAELVDLPAKCRLENLSATGLRVAAPSCGSLADVDKAARKTGDTPVLSATDRDILALARDLGASLHTDDFAVQNVAHALGITTVPLRQKQASPVRWRFRCTGCGRYYRETGECPVCGAMIKRRLK